MTMQKVLRPTGRRKMTPLQLRAELAADALPARPPATTPGRALAAFKRAEPALGVSAQVVKFIDYLVGCTREVDWDGTGLGPIAWPSDAELEDRLGVGRSRCKQIVRAALDDGFVRLRRSANGKRYGVRTAGRITLAFGFDLSPLAERTKEFEAATTEWEARRAEGKRLRREIGSLHGAIRSLIDLAVCEGVGGHDWAALAAQADALLDQRGRSRDPLSLVPIAARLKARHVLLRESLIDPIKLTVGNDNCSSLGPQNRPHNITTKDDNIVKTIAGIANATGQEEKKFGVGRLGGPDQEQNLQCPLRGFVVTPSLVLAMAPSLNPNGTSTPLSWSSLGETALSACGELGISPHAWRQASVVLGRQAAIVALATISARHGLHLVRSPGGLLRRMVELHRDGALRLDLTLFGLVARLKLDRSIQPAAVPSSSSCSAASGARYVASTPAAGQSARS